MSFSYKIKSEVWLYPGMSGWHFVSVDKKTGEKINKSVAGKLKRGFGAVRVEVTLGKCVWQTSIFPDKRSGTYLLPLKMQVRKKEGIMAGDKVLFKIESK